MAARIGEFVLAGELRNTRRNCVFGWLEFAPEFGIRIELTGNLAGDLAGKHIRFRIKDYAKHAVDPAQLPEMVSQLADRQIGVVDDMRLGKCSLSPNTDGDSPSLPGDGPSVSAHQESKLCLNLRWFSQNGAVVARIVDPDYELVEADDASASPEDSLMDGNFGAGFAEVNIDEDESEPPDLFDLDDEDEEGEEDDPFGLFGGDLERRLADSLDAFPSGPDDDGYPGLILPGNEPSDPNDLDPETRALYEQWDEIFEGNKDEPISCLFETPLRLPRAANVHSDEEAAGYVKLILAQLALLSVALDVCEHFSPIDTYRVLMEDILPNAKVHPNLAASEMVQHYSTSDYCAACEAEFDTDHDPPPEDGSGGKEDGDNDLDG